MRRLFFATRFAVRLPITFIGAEIRIRRFDAVYWKVLNTLKDKMAGAWSDAIEKDLSCNFRSYAIRIAYFQENFAAMAGVALDETSAICSGLFTPLYDACFDGDVGVDVQNLIRDLENGIYRSSVNRKLALLNIVYAQISEKHPREENALLYITLDSLHEAQLSSLAQKLQTTTLDEILEISNNKGATSTLVLCLLVKKALSPIEIGAISKMGMLFQRFDDYEDKDVDKKNGIRTPATENLISPATLFRDLMRVNSELLSIYAGNRRQAMNFCEGLVCWFALDYLSAAFSYLGTRIHKIIPRIFTIRRLFPNSD